MIRHFYRNAMAAVLGLLPVLAFAGVAPAAADTPTQSASVTISDTGYSPSSVTVFLGGTVAFTNSGSILHTATTTGGAPLPFDSGGLNPGQATSFNFTLAGTYAFNSATDCLNGNSSAQFKCGGGVVTVVAAGVPASASAPPASAAPPAAAPAPPAGSPQQGVTVTITDKGVSPASATVSLGGSVTWINQSSAQVHTATTTGGPVPFDTGGLGPGQSSTLTFATPGTYTYSSAPDCTNGSNPAGFSCGPYSVIVSSTPGAPAPIASGTTASATPLPVVSNTNVTIDETNGFAPNTLTIRAGQTVTWTNTGNNVHTVTSNSGYTPAFDSGGMNKGQKFSQQFATAGTFGYHSQIETIYTTDPNNNNTVTTTYQYNGTIVVQ